MFDQGYWPQSAEVFVYLARPRVGMCAHSGYTPRHFSLSLMYPCLLCNTFQGLSFFQVWFPATLRPLACVRLPLPACLATVVQPGAGRGPAPAKRADVPTGAGLGPARVLPGETLQLDCDIHWSGPPPLPPQ